MSTRPTDSDFFEFYEYLRYEHTEEWAKLARVRITHSERRAAFRDMMSNPDSPHVKSSSLAAVWLHWMGGPEAIRDRSPDITGFHSLDPALPDDLDRTLWLLGERIKAHAKVSEAALETIRQVGLDYEKHRGLVVQPKPGPGRPRPILHDIVWIICEVYEQHREWPDGQVAGNTSEVRDFVSRLLQHSGLVPARLYDESPGGPISDAIESRRTKTQRRKFRRR